MPVRLPTLLLVAAAIALVVHSLAYNFVTDDAYISFVYARNFAEHGELSFNLGDPVEGYTNFLWTILLGALMVPGIPPELSSRVLGTACAIITLLLAARIMRRAIARGESIATRSAAKQGSGSPCAEGTPRGGASPENPWPAVPALLLAVSSGFACWSSGGLETQLFTALCTGALDGVVAAVDRRRALRRAGALLALAAMTRPEGLLVAAVFGAVWIAHRLATRTDRDIREELLAAAWFLGLWLPWFAWRWWYYGWPAPNTYYVKAAGAWIDAASARPRLASDQLDNGVYYIWTWLRQTRLLYALPLALVGIAAHPRGARGVAGLACGALALAYVPYTISVGGDFMGLHRFIMPLFVAAALATTLGLERLARFVPERRRALAAALACVALVGAFAVTQVQLTQQSLRSRAPDRGIDTPGFLAVYTADRAKIGRAMAPCFRDDDFSIVGGAGAQPYHGRMRGIDVFGLVSARIAHEEPRVKARAGHTKWGSDALLASYDPDFVFSCYQIHGAPQPPRLGCDGFWRARGYETVTMHIPGLEERGTYYTFLAKRSRSFECPGRVR